MVTHYSSLVRRFFAYVLDGLILSIPLCLANFVVPVLGGFLVYFLYAPVLESSRLKATLGKYILGIQVCREDGGILTFREALVRNLFKFLSSVLFFIFFFLAFFTDKKQTLHDLLTDSIVVYGKENLSIGKEWLRSAKNIFSFDFFALSEHDNIEKLERLQKLKEQGALTEDEFQMEKKKILLSDDKD